MESGGNSSPSDRRRARHASYAGAAEKYASSPASPASPSGPPSNKSRTSALDRARARSARWHQNVAQAAETPSPQPAGKAGAAAAAVVVANKPTIAERKDLPALELSVPTTLNLDIAPSDSSDVSGLTLDNAAKSGPSSGRLRAQETPLSLYRITEQSRSSAVGAGSGDINNASRRKPASASIASARGMRLSVQRSAESAYAPAISGSRSREDIADAISSVIGVQKSPLKSPSRTAAKSAEAPSLALHSPIMPSASREDMADTIASIIGKSTPQSEVKAAEHVSRGAEPPTTAQVSPKPTGEASTNPLTPHLSTTTIPPHPATNTAIYSSSPNKSTPDGNMQRGEKAKTLVQTPEQIVDNKRDLSQPVSQDRSPLQFIKNATASKATPDGTVGRLSLSPPKSPSLSSTKPAAVAVSATATRVVAQAVHRDPRHSGSSRSPPRSPQQDFFMNAFASASSILGAGGPQLPNLGSSTSREKAVGSERNPLPPKKSPTDEGVEINLGAVDGGAETSTRAIDLQPNFSRESNISIDEGTAAVDAELLNSVGNFIDSLSGHGQRSRAKEGQTGISSNSKVESPVATEQKESDIEDAAAAIDDIRSDDEGKEEDAAAAIDESRSSDDASEEGGNVVDPTIRENIGAFIDSLQQSEDQKSSDPCSSENNDEKIPAVQEQSKGEKESTGGLECEDDDAFVLDINALEAATAQVDHTTSESKDDETSQEIPSVAKSDSGDVSSEKEPEQCESGAYGTSASGVQLGAADATSSPDGVVLEPKSTALRAIEEYKKLYVSSEDLLPSDEEMLELYVGKATYLLESKVPIKEAAAQILRSSRKHGVSDDVVIKIFQAIKAVGYDTSKAENQPEATQLTKDVDEAEPLTGYDQEKPVEEASSPVSNDEGENRTDKDDCMKASTEPPIHLPPPATSDPFDDEESYDSDVSETFQRKTVAEMRNVNDGDMEVYLMDEENVEVAYIDEAGGADIVDNVTNEKEGEEEEEEKSDTHISQPEEMTTINGNDQKVDTPLKDGDVEISPKQHEKLKRRSPRGTKGSKSNKRAIDDNISAANDELAPVASYEYYQPGEPEKDFKKMILRQQIFQKQSLEEQPSDGDSVQLGGVAAAIAIAQRSPRHESQSNKILYSKRPVYRRSYQDRTREHSGYFDIDFYSLSDATAINQEAHRLDEESWEDRDVKQRFLHEKSISFSRNWFGSATLTRGNDRNFEPVCHPKSMPMPLDQLKKRLPQPGEWEEEWYMSWKSRKENPDALFSSIVTNKKREQERSSNKPRDKYALDHDEDSSFSDDEEHVPADKTWKDPPEFGKLCTIRYKVGEPRSRLNWFLTSRLRRSRFRKKYFPHGLERETFMR